VIFVKLFDKLDRYLVDNDYKVTISSKGVHIINYLEIVDFSCSKVIVKYRDGVTTFIGRDLVVSKMLEDEVFITGKLDSIVYN
jgi:hypothetical protein